MANSQTITINVKAIADMKDVLTNVNSIQSALSKMKLPPDLKNSFNETFRGLEKEVAKYQELLSKKNPGKGDISALEKSGEKISKLYDNIIQKMGSIDNKTLKAAFKDLGTEEVARLKQEISDLQVKFADVAKNSDFAKGLKDGFNTLKQDIGTTNEKATELVNKLGKTTFNTFFKNLEGGRFDLATKNLESIKQQIDALEDTTQKTRLQEWFTKISSGFEQLKSSSNIQGLTTQLTELKSKLTGSEAKFVQSLIDGFRNGTIQIEGTKVSLDNLIESQRKSATEQANLNSELSQVKSRIQYFLGLNNAVNLFRRAVRSAFNTVKELDKAMTETAVVTDFSVGDMWNQLPRYTATANELGVTTKGAYETMTLFYQQGLDTNEAFALGTETMKMARIAGMEYTEATDAMTAALRGFNMELNETSAQRVNDVYSELAAKTASDVEEISTAMSKVASIAHNAGMEFETTSAFLSQIIETTREAPETAGTALKTVIARFTELKKAPTEIGEVDGEIVDANKIETALKSVGVALRDTKGEFRDLDDVFIELSSKWDGLTKNQQRYVATMAAGSRQQSRFIAMMSDYERTQELIGEAYDSSGASQKQYEKTLDSLESKLNKLKNAWNEFLMGITDSNLIKGFVDMLTKLLNGLNKFSDLFGKNSGLIKVLMTLTAWKGLRGILGKGGGILGTIFKASEGKVAGDILTKLVVNLGKATASLKNFSLATYSINTLKAGFSATSLVAKEFLTVLGSIALQLLPIVAIVGAIALAAQGIYLLWKHNTLSGQLKTIKQFQETLQNVASNAQDAKDSLEDVTNTYKELTDAINNATTAEEKAAAIQERNEFVNKTVQDNEEYGAFLQRNYRNGELVLSFDEDSLARAVANAEEGLKKLSIETEFTNAAATEKQIAIYEKQMSRQGVNLETNTIQDYNEEGIAYIRQMSEAETRYWQGIQIEIQKLTSEVSNYAKNAYSQMLENSNLEDSVANGLASVLGQSWTEEGYSDRVAARKGELLDAAYSKDELRALYYQTFGTNADTELKGRDLVQLIAEAQANEIEDTRVDAIAAKIAADTTDKYNSYFSAIGGDFGNQNLLTQAGADLVNELGNEDELKEIAATLLGIEAVNEDDTAQMDLINEQVSKMQGTLQDSYRQQVAQQVKNNLATTSTLKQYQGYNDDFIRSLWDVEDLELQADISNIATKFGEVGLGEAISGTLQDAINGVSFKDTYVQEWLNSLDFSDPLQGFLQLQQGFSNADPKIRALAEDLTNAAKQSEEFSSANMVGLLVTSEGYDDLSEKLHEFIKENGHISTQNIDELAESNALLNDLLATGIVNAQGLAEALTLIENGTLSFDQLTDSLLSALSVGKSFTQLTDDVQNWMDTFNEGKDYTEGTEFVQDQLEEIQKLIDNYEFGNDRLRSIYDEIFGAGKYDEYMSERWNTQTPEQIAEALGNSVKWYQDANQYEGLGALQWLSKQGTISGLSAIDDYNFEWDLSGYESTQQAIEQVASQLKVSDEYAEALIESWASHMWDFSQEWDALNYDTVLQEFASKLSGGEESLTNETIQAFADSVGKGYDEVVQDLAGKDVDITAIVKTVDEQGNPLTGEDLQRSVRSSFGGGTYRQGDYETSWEGQEWKEIEKKAHRDGQKTGRIIPNSGGIEEYIPESYDIEAIIKPIVDKGYTQEQAEEYANTWAEETGNLLSKTITVPSITFDEQGELIISEDQVTVTGANTDELEAQTETAMETAQANVDAQILAYALGSADYSGITTAITTAIDSAFNTKRTVTVQVNANWANVHVPKALQGYIAARGGYVPSYASGGHKLHAGPALTGEEAPEIVWNKDKGYAYITGQNGPEFQNLQPGDRVFNAAETNRIFRNSKQNGFNSFASGGWNVKNVGGSVASSNKKGTVAGTKASKSSSDKVEAEAEFWENELDWLYNLLEDIAALQQEANQLQALQDAYMSDDSKTGKDLYKLLVKQLGNLNAQLLGNQQLLERREQEMGEFMSQTNRFPDLVRYNSEDRTLEIDWDAIDQLNKTDYDMVTEFISKAEDIQSNIRDAENAVLDVEAELREFENVWRDEYINFEETVGQALINSQQKVIDNYSDLNDTLSNNNSQILNSLSESISLSRQIRDNTKTEEEIADMEARLAYLRRDTTGGNQAEIKSLEKELEDARQSYEDTLVDQALDRLKDENDAAAEQRQQEIDLMQAQLDYAEQSGEFNKEIRDLIESARDEGGGFRADSELMALLKEDADFNAKTADAQNQWMDELLTTFKTVSGYVEKQEQESTGNFANEIVAVLQDEINKHDALPESSGTDRDIGSPNGDIGSQSQGAFHVDVNKDYTGWVQNEKTGDWYYTKKGEVQTGWIKSGSKWYYMDESRGGIMATGETVDKKGNIYWLGTSGAYTSGWAKGENGDWYYTKDGYAYNGWKYSSGKWYYIDHGKMARGWASTPNGYTYLDPTTGAYAGGTKGREIDGQTYYFDAYGYAQNLTDEQISAIEAAIKKRKGQTEGFLTGGLTSKTGFAMLHGTPSAPEYVLNATQTQAFLKLADVLPSVLNQNTGAAGALGGINLNLVMNVDEIGSDYDVDRIANRVKEIIYNAGSYRNVNTLNFLR